MPLAAPLSTLSIAGLLALGSPRSTPDPENRPRLVVVASLGPLLPDQIERLEPWLAGGLARFHEQGRNFVAAELDYAITDAPAGAATISTGLEPRHHGIAGDTFLDRAAGRHRFATHDQGVLLHAPGGILTQATPGGDSPVHLLAPGIADHLRAAFPGARCISVGGEARLAVLLAGRQPDQVLWWDRRAGGFTSSSWYGPELPEFVLAWNRSWVEQASGHVWEPLIAGPLPGSGFGPDRREGEIGGPGGAVLPVELPRIGAAGAPLEFQTLANVVHASPLMDRFTIDLALEALTAFALGSDDEPDLLCIALTACETVAGRTGPYSRETADVLLRADRELERLFNALDERVGPERWIAVLASTSGLLELPEALRERGVGARRISSSDTRRSLARVREALEERFGAWFGAGLPGAVLTLEPSEIERAGADPIEVRRAARAALIEAGDWLAGAYTFDEIVGYEGEAEDAWLELYRRSFHPSRAPDIALRLEPWTLLNARAGTEHGSPYPYDRRILLAFLGPGFAPGRSYDPARAEDVLPTLLERLGAPIPEGLDGRALPVTSD